MLAVSFPSINSEWHVPLVKKGWVACATGASFLYLVQSSSTTGACSGEPFREQTRAYDPQVAGLVNALKDNITASLVLNSLNTLRFPI